MFLVRLIYYVIILHPLFGIFWIFTYFIFFIYFCELLFMLNQVHVSINQEFFTWIFDVDKTNLQDLSFVSSYYDLIFCSQTLNSNFWHTFELLIQNFENHIFWDTLLSNKVRKMCRYIRFCSVSCDKRLNFGCNEMIFMKVYSRFNHFSTFYLYCKPDLDDTTRIVYHRSEGFINFCWRTQWTSLWMIGVFLYWMAWQCCFWLL